MKNIYVFENKSRFELDEKSGLEFFALICVNLNAQILFDSRISF